MWRLARERRRYGRCSVTHDEAIDTFLNQVVKGTDGSVPAAGVLRQAQQHVRDCSDCWEFLDLLNVLAKGRRDPDSARMAALYGCDRVRRELYLLVGID